MSFFNNKDARKQSLMQALKTPRIENNNPDYYRLAQESQLPSVSLKEDTPQLIQVTLDQLKPYQGNPRRTKNPAFEEIKESIRSRGLDHAPNITKRPNDPFYTILDGGNTRLQALKELYQETQDPKFWTIGCIYKRWQSNVDELTNELHMLIGHLAENDVRGELSFIEKALGIQEVRKLYEKKYAKYFSYRELATKLTKNGYPTNHSLLSKMDRCINFIFPFIPDVLLNGLGRPQINNILSLRTKAENSFQEHAYTFTPSNEFDELWGEALKPFNEHPDEFSLSLFQDELVGEMVASFQHQIPFDTFVFELTTSEKIRQEIKDNVIEKTQETLQEIEEESQKETQKRENFFDSRGRAFLPSEEVETEDEEGEIFEDFDDADNVERVETENDVPHYDTATVVENREKTATEFPFTPLQQAFDLAHAIASHYDFDDCLSPTESGAFVVNELIDNDNDIVEFVHGMLSVLATENSHLKTETIVEISNEMLDAIPDEIWTKLTQLIRLHRSIKGGVNEE